MAVLAAWSGSTWSSTNGLTLNGLQDFAGRRLFVVGGDRGGGQTVTLSGSDAGLVTALDVPIVEDVTLPTGGTDRRSAWMWSCIIPTVASNPVVSPDIRDGSNVMQTGSVVAWVEDIGSSYTLAEVANANSGSGTTTSQTTGTTASVAAGDVLTAVGACIRGDGTTTWTTAEDEPANPGGGTWLLEVTSGTGAGQRHVVGGRADLPGQSSQTWADTLTLGTARQTTALIAVFVAATAGTPEVTASIPLGIAVAGSTTAGHDVTAGHNLEVAVTSTAQAASEVTAGISLTLALAGQAAVDHDAVAAVPLGLQLAPTTDAPGIASVTASIPLAVAVTAASATARDAAATVGIVLALTVVAATDHEVTAPVPLLAVVSPAAGADHSVTASVPLGLALAATTAAQNPARPGTATLVEPTGPSVTAVPPRIPTAGGVA